MTATLEAVRPQVRMPRLRDPEAAPKGEVRELKDRYLAWLISTGYAETTIKGAHADLEWLLRFLEMRAVKRAADITPDVLEGFSLWLRDRQNCHREHETISLAHVVHRLTTLKSFCRWLVKEMVILQDPAEDLEMPRLGERLPRMILTQEEARAMLDAPELRSPVGYRDKALLELLYATGVRSNELVKMKVSDLDFKARSVFVRKGKGNKQRLILIPAEPMGYAREYVEKVRPRFAGRMKGGDDGTLFLNYTGARVEINALCALIRKNAKLARIDKHVTALTFRHSLASHLLENGMDIRFIQELLGHEKMSTTQVYAKVTLSGLKKHYNKHHPREKRFRGTDERRAV